MHQAFRLPLTTIVAQDSLMHMRSICHAVLCMQMTYGLSWFLVLCWSVSLHVPISEWYFFELQFGKGYKPASVGKRIHMYARYRDTESTTEKSVREAEVGPGG